MTNLDSMETAVTLAGVIHDDGEGAETHHHHKVDHEHATSHQSFKFHHFHAVPVYVKKEDQQFLKHPVEVGGIKHKLKILHPETEHAKGHGLTLENHGEEHHAHHHHHHDSGHAGSEPIISNAHEYVPQYHDIAVNEEQS
ncbi:uncharacterized histidine-rich protein DDB_G0274557-like [Culicoides brevitarsis]|uniref:uncharacterized histidine-rich protein DDB_G0274557-like n=1 Tax=Culicoides brevitarsis TaxID=469753 RepID=UPI00307B93EF